MSYSTRDLDGENDERPRRGIRTAAAFVKALFSLREEELARAGHEPGPGSAMGHLGEGGGVDAWAASHRDLLEYRSELLERLERIWCDLPAEDRRLLTTLHSCSYAAAAEDLGLSLHQVHRGVKRATRAIEENPRFSDLGADV